MAVCVHAVGWDRFKAGLLLPSIDGSIVLKPHKPLPRLRILDKALSKLKKLGRPLCH